MMFGKCIFNGTNSCLLLKEKRKLDHFLMHFIRWFDEFTSFLIKFDSNHLFRSCLHDSGGESMSKKEKRNLIDQ